jgi:ABC-2 type transport system ATP-binding protein
MSTPGLTNALGAQYSTIAQNNGSMVTIRNLTKRFQQILAVNNLSFDIPNGEVFGLLGSNGAGKTTTLQIIAGLLKPTFGSVYISGLNVQHHPLQIRSKLGYLPESPAVYEQLTGKEFLNFIGRLRGLPEDILDKRVSKMASILDLEDRIDSKLSSYSKGMKQKISFASTILHNPELVLLDEPISGLDPRYGRLIKDWIARNKKRKKTIILSSHMTELVEAICTRVMILDKGCLKGFGTVEYLKSVTGTSSLEDVFIQLTGGRILAEF